MILSKRLQSAFSQMILFNGPLSFSPNTINNNYMTYAFAKRWEEENGQYNQWMTLISKVREISNDVRAYASSTGKNVGDYDIAFFNDWNVEGDGAVYTQFTAKTIFDPTKDQPFTVLSQKEQFPASSPMGFHKAAIADMDTDSQSKSKLFGLQLIIDNKLSLALEPGEFRNMTRKYIRDKNGVGNYAADWFLNGKMIVQSHKDTYSAKHSVLDSFMKEIQAGNENPKLLQKYILRMNQFNYNSQTKLSFVSGYIEATPHKESLPTVHWRRIFINFGENSQREPFEPDPKIYLDFSRTLYMRQVKNNDKVLGILLDLNSLLQVVTVNGHFNYKDRIVLKINPKDEKISNNSFNIELTKNDLQNQCGMHFISGASLLDVPYNLRVEYYQDQAKTFHPTKEQSKHHAKQFDKVNGSKEDSVRYFEGTESEFTFEIVQRFKKTKQVEEGDTPKNVQHFQPSITYEFRCMRFGKNIPADILKKIDSKVTLKIMEPEYQNGPMDFGGIFSYSDGRSDDILKEALAKSPQFAKKYKDMKYIDQHFYLSRYKTIRDIADSIKNQLEKVNDPNKPEKNTYFWKNSKGQHFAGQFNNSATKQQSQKIQEVKLDENGRGTFEIYLNQNLTRFNNPRRLISNQSRNKQVSNPILSSIAIQCNISATFKKCGTQITTQTDGISGIYFESNPDLGERIPDWKNYVGPRLRLMGLLYPAMQKIIDLYSFNNVNLDAMKRAFDIQEETHSRYMPSTREISPFQHRMIRRWLYEPYFDNQRHTNIDFKKICIKSDTIQGKKTFKQKKDKLRERLKDAFAFELFTIPLYLTAIYTTDSAEYQQRFREVLHDQMKHLFIVSNLINAIREPGCGDYCQGPPYLDEKYVPSFVQGTPSVPRYVYNTTNSSQAIKDLYSFNIFPLNDQVLLKMIAAEFPSETKNLVLSLEGVPLYNQTKIDEVQRKVIDAVNKQQAINKDFHTIGELYAEIVAMLWDLNDLQTKDNVLFSGDAVMQFTYPQLTNMIEIYSLRTALNQIRLIVDEGEGARIFDVKNQLKKLSHFLKFVEIYTGCKVDQELTHGKNSPYKSQKFTIYFKAHQVTKNQHKNKWTQSRDQDGKIRKIVGQELPGTRGFGYSEYTNVASIKAFNNVYKKILLELHYVFNSNFSNFKKYYSKKSGIDENNLVAVENAFKNFKFRRMENAIAKMRQMSLHARYNIRPQPIPNYEIPAPMTNNIESKYNHGLSVRPDFNIHAEFPED